MREFLQQQQRSLRRFRQAELRRFVPVSTLFFVGALIGGAVYCLLFPDRGEEIIQQIMNMTASADVVDEEGRLFFLGILRNNWRAMLVIACSGLVPFLFLPALSLGYNGVIIGVLLAYYHQRGLPVMAAIAGILPHGVFELPALILAGAAGVCLCRGATRTMVRWDEGFHPLLRKLENVLRLLLLELFPLLLIAALVETYITPLVMGWFF